ncbi:hypothetical protein [Tissierella pigra]|nr:hypothetical protein [Tissierella pigra]
MKDIGLLRVDVIIVNEKNYDASYFGKKDLAGFKDYVYGAFCVGK